MENQIRTFSFLLTEIDTERERERETHKILSCYAAAKNKLITSRLNFCNILVYLFFDVKGL